MYSGQEKDAKGNDGSDNDGSDSDGSESEGKPVGIDTEPVGSEIEPMGGEPPPYEADAAWLTVECVPAVPVPRGVVELEGGGGEPVPVPDEPPVVVGAEGVDWLPGRVPVPLGDVEFPDGRDPVPVEPGGADEVPLLPLPPDEVPLAAHTPRGPEVCGGAPASVVFVQYWSVQLLLGSMEVKIWLPWAPFDWYAFLM